MGGPQLLRTSTAQGGYFNVPFFGCRLVHILSVGTVGGTTKPISKVKVTYLFSSDEYDAFVNYVVGHPEEFPQNKYIVIRFD